MAKKSQRRRTMKMGGGDFTSNVYGGINEQHAMAGRGNEIATNMGSLAGPQMGGTRGRRKRRRRGGGLTELAVPAVLLYANQVLGSTRSFKSRKITGGKRHRKRNKTVRFRKSRRH